MGLMQLLTVGRSLDETRYRPHRYKLLNGAMPTFGAVSGAKVRQKSDLAASGAGERENEPADINRAGDGDPTMKTEAAETMGKAPATNAVPVRRWALKGNPFKSSVKPAPLPAIQGELSLEKVKVVRNDLSDSDLELVAASKPVATAEVNSGNVFAAGAETKRISLLARVKARWFRAKAR